jgi:hypothetical protein
VRKPKPAAHAERPAERRCRFSPKQGQQQTLVFQIPADRGLNHPSKQHGRGYSFQRRLSRSLDEYGIAAEDMEPDFKVKALGKNCKLDSRRAPSSRQTPRPSTS